MRLTRRIIGYPLYVAGGIALFGVGLWSLIIILGIVGEVAGFWGFVIGFVAFPITFLAVPWYALIVQGNAFPLVLGYGGGFIAAALMGIGAVIRGDS